MSIHLDLVGESIAKEVTRLWPDETLADRFNCVIEEVGEACRAATKRRHALVHGTFKGRTPEEWTDNLRTELAQAIGVILDIAHREGFSMEIALVEVEVALMEREV